MKTFTTKQITAILLSLSLSLSVASCRHSTNETSSFDTEHTEFGTSDTELPVSETTTAEIITETDLMESDIETETEELTSITDIGADPILSEDSLQIVAEYQYADLPEITGQTSNPNIFTTADAETPFLYFGEDGLVPCEVEITEYPMSLMIGDISLSDIYTEYTYDGEIIFLGTNTSCGINAGSQLNIYPEISILQGLHKVGNEIYCNLIYQGIHNIVVYNVDQNTFTSLHNQQAPIEDFFDLEGQKKILPRYVTHYCAFSPDRTYMVYAVSEQYGDLELTYYLYDFFSQTSTLICDKGFTAKSIYGGTSGESIFWMDDHTLRLQLLSDTLGFVDVYIEKEGKVRIIEYTIEEARNISHDLSGYYYRHCYRFDFNDTSNIMRHIYDDTISVAVASIAAGAEIPILFQKSGMEFYYNPGAFDVFMYSNYLAVIYFQQFYLYDVRSWSVYMFGSDVTTYLLRDGILAFKTNMNDGYDAIYYQLLSE